MRWTRRSTRARRKLPTHQPDAVLEGRFAFLRVDRVDNVAIIALDRPPVNAVNQTMYEEIRELFGGFDALLPDCTVAILRGAGDHFCAGVDLGEFLTLTSENSPRRMQLVREVFAALYDCPVPVIAAVRGAALGTGVALAGSCDLVLCAPSAIFGAPEVSVGVMGAAKHLSRLVPQSLVRLMYYTAETVSGRELLRYGGVVEVVDDDQLETASLELARRIARHSPIAVRTAKESLNASTCRSNRPMSSSSRSPVASPTTRTRSRHGARSRRSANRSGENDSTNQPDHRGEDARR